MTIVNAQLQEIRELQAQNLLKIAKLNNQNPAEIDPILAGEIDRGEVGATTNVNELNELKVLDAKHFSEFSDRIFSLEVPKPIIPKNSQKMSVWAIASQASVGIALISATLGLIAGYLIWGLTP